ncbi:hypothetical protein IWW51_004852 [Coemansia sp. RSA 2702]|nr:hypothetical protein IWW54_005409 [Coemansia sp. RSA 2705]KAJ2311389.1 hypothetical protein IWW52_005151 [Coemansia sp. RSA 2704]KAJ2319504.1 hypothetical protein IWW51_004852 [Coemansia sp. RSA 2702]KAJ2718292.1 hypothetical protein H4R23_005053 [Coemansia sp. Cherry 401B]
MDEEFRLLVAEIAQHKDSAYYRAAHLDARVASASRDARSIVVEFTARDSEIGHARCLDEGLVATVADFWTSALITAISGGRGAVTTTLSVQALKHLTAGTRVHVLCSATSPDSHAMPYATARFVSAADHNDVLALATHTKFFKAK